MRPPPAPPRSVATSRHVWLGWTCQESVGWRHRAASWENSILRGAEVTVLVSDFLLQGAEIHSILGNGIWRKDAPGPENCR